LAAKIPANFSSKRRPNTAGLVKEFYIYSFELPWDHALLSQKVIRSLGLEANESTQQQKIPLASFLSDKVKFFNQGSW